ncbi:MAG: hypothetical protein A3D15_04430 [Alphaproteobacteria bacterium RIFCSPHIGHO2_02_FULL_40_34]|nr:MAG: hypothetical protein A3D15_04430 [Alphaproteobacteria bacterium RIFCSPHIGHO2_02_FULL_40_34]OFX09485.1 MAG: hypothetical protein A3H30_02220 [Alphaproteobacteria bacterium RIFCSPLOWO2_02_FULL_40_19]OFX11117.1 MAG: hypothetical protein A3G22_02780 [Alphaproteobacteria bacterium RIFCSPLOWO2_12_FULL_40_11]
MKFYSDNKFLLICCSVIFAISIFLRSTMDIGVDTGAYIDSARKITEGKGYYYGFFDGNFPFSFYFYALQYKLSELTGISPLILSEIVINSLALLSIFFSSKILQRGAIYQNRAHYNLIIISCFLGFFLRYNIIAMGEFGTKTSLLLILLFPYISYCLSGSVANPHFLPFLNSMSPHKSMVQTFWKVDLRRGLSGIKNFDNKNLIARGCLMGLIPCLKPHYLVFVIFGEFYLIYKNRKIVDLSRLIMLLIGALYLFLIIKFAPEFFEFMVPMAAKAYLAYNNEELFAWNIIYNIGAMMPFFFIFLIFLRLKFSESDLVLTLFLIASAFVILLENIGSLDQYAIFLSIATICYAKFAYDLFSSKEISFSRDQIVIALAMILSVFDFGILYGGIGFIRCINFWWVFTLAYVVVLIFKKNGVRAHLGLFLVLCVAIMLCVALAIKQFPDLRFIIHLSAIFAILFLFEKRIYSQIANHFSPLLLFAITTLICGQFYSYAKMPILVAIHKNPYTFPNRLSDVVAYYSKLYAPRQQDGIVMISDCLCHIFPTLHYLNKGNSQKQYAAMLQTGNYQKNGLMFPIKNPDEVFTYFYLMDDVKNAIKNPATKVVFVNNSKSATVDYKRCRINILEFYFLDYGFKKSFLKNFHFENRMVNSVFSKKAPSDKIFKDDSFDRISKSESVMFHDFEIYVRNEDR